MDSKNVSKKSLKFNTAALWQRITVLISVNPCLKNLCALCGKKFVLICVNSWLIFLCALAP
jgi:hypothetical protein